MKIFLFKNYPNSLRISEGSIYRRDLKEPKPGRGWISAEWVWLRKGV